MWASPNQCAVTLPPLDPGQSRHSTPARIPPNACAFRTSSAPKPPLAPRIPRTHGHAQHSVHVFVYRMRASRLPQRSSGHTWLNTNCPPYYPISCGDVREIFFTIKNLPMSPSTRDAEKLSFRCSRKVFDTSKLFAYPSNGESIPYTISVKRYDQIRGNSPARVKLTLAFLVAWSLVQKKGIRQKKTSLE